MKVYIKLVISAILLFASLTGSYANEKPRMVFRSQRLDCDSMRVRCTIADTSYTSAESYWVIKEIRTDSYSKGNIVSNTVSMESGDLTLLEKEVVFCFLPNVLKQFYDFVAEKKPAPGASFSVPFFIIKEEKESPVVIQDYSKERSYLTKISNRLSVPFWQRHYSLSSCAPSQLKKLRNYSISHLDKTDYDSSDTLVFIELTSGNPNESSFDEIYVFCSGSGNIWIFDNLPENLPLFRLVDSGLDEPCHKRIIELANCIREARWNDLKAPFSAFEDFDFKMIHIGMFVRDKKGRFKPVLYECTNKSAWYLMQD